MPRAWVRDPWRSWPGVSTEYTPTRGPPTHPTSAKAARQTTPRIPQGIPRNAPRATARHALAAEDYVSRRRARRASGCDASLLEVGELLADRPELFRARIVLGGTVRLFLGA